MSTLAKQEASRETAFESGTASDFTSLLENEINAKSDEVKREIQSAVRSLAEHALANTNLIRGEAVDTIKALIHQIDRKLSDQVNEIMHHPDMIALEGSWRGLHRLVMESELSDQLQIRVFNARKRDVGKMLRRFDGARFDQSPLFKRLYEDEFGTPGGQPFGCIVGDYYFDHSAEDVEFLKGMAAIAASAHAPFVSATAPSMFRAGSFAELADPADIAKLFTTPDYAPWRSFRESDDSRFVALAMPRTLARLPYGEKGRKVEEFEFEESVDPVAGHGFVWSNAAYALAQNINRAFANHGWCSSIAGVQTGGVVEGLPIYTFPSDDGSVDLKCPTEIAITDRREQELSKAGFAVLQHYKNTDKAFFPAVQSAHKPKAYVDPEATANARLGANLSYMFACSRFAHYLKCMIRDQVGSSREAPELRKWLQTWINQYVLTNPDQKSDEEKAKKPLSSASVEVVPVEDNPGYYTTTILLRPHFQLQGMTVSLRLVSKDRKAQAR